MELLNLMLADYASIDSAGKLNMIGVFGVIYAKEIPCTHRSMHLVIKLGADIGEFDETRKLTVRLLDEDASEIGAAVIDFAIPSNTQGIRPELYVIIEFRDIVFSTIGRYEFRVFVDKDSKGWLPLDVIQMKSPEEQNS